MGYTSKEFGDDLYYSTVWWGEAFNPIGPFINPERTFTKRGIAQKASAATVGGFAMWGAYALTGGGATHHVAREIARPTLFRSAALSVDKYRAMGQAVGNVATTVARGAVRSIPAISAMALLYGAGHVLQDAYYGLAGMHIGDLRFVR